MLQQDFKELGLGCCLSTFLQDRGGLAEPRHRLKKSKNDQDSDLLVFVFNMFFDILVTMEDICKEN